MSTETRLSIRIDKKELESLKKYAESQHKTFSDWVRETLLRESGAIENPDSDLRERLEALERIVYQQQSQAA